MNVAGFTQREHACARTRARLELIMDHLKESIVQRKVVVLQRHEDQEIVHESMYCTLTLDAWEKKTTSKRHCQQV